MKQNVTASLFLICFAFSVALFGQARGRPQTFEGTITIPNGNTVRPSQPSSLAGTVVSESTGEPISGATVRLRRSFEIAVLLLLSEEEAGGAIPPVQTNDKGSFSFEGLVANSYDGPSHFSIGNGAVASCECRHPLQLQCSRRNV